MAPTPPPPRGPDPWHALRQVTPARIALGRAGGSLPTRELLDFNLAHALARDAVHHPFDPEQLGRDLAPLNHPFLHLKSAALDRQTYLLRPVLGRQLADESSHSAPPTRFGAYLVYRGFSIRPAE